MSISAKLCSVPELSLSGIDNITVPENRLAEFAKLLLPTTYCLQQIDHDLNYRFADVTIMHFDGTTTNLIVRWTGHNPAAISLDDRNYYYGGFDGFPDGATRIVHLLHEYHFDRHK